MYWVLIGNDPNGTFTPNRVMELGRRFIGIDISEEYCEIARKRVEVEKER